MSVIPDMTPAPRSRKPRPWLATPPQEQTNSAPNIQSPPIANLSTTQVTRPGAEFPQISAASATHVQEKRLVEKSTPNPSSHQPPRQTIHAPPSNPIKSASTDLCLVWKDKAVAEVKVRCLSLFNTLYVACASPIHIVGEFMLTMLSLFFWSHPPLHPFVERTVFDSGFHYVLGMPFVLTTALMLFLNAPTLDWMLNVLISLVLLVTLPLLAWLSLQNGPLASVGFGAWSVSAAFVTLYWLNLTLIRTTFMSVIMVFVMVGIVFAWMQRLHTICFSADNFFDISEGTHLQPRPVGMSMEAYMASLGIANREIRRHWSLAHQKLYILCRTGLFNHNSTDVVLLPTASPASVNLKKASHSHVETYIVSTIISIIMHVEVVMDGSKMKAVARAAQLVNHIIGTIILGVLPKEADTSNKGHFVLTSLPKSIINDGFNHWTSVTGTIVVPPTPPVKAQQVVAGTPAPLTNSTSISHSHAQSNVAGGSISRKRKPKPSRQHDSAHFIEQ